MGFLNDAVTPIQARMEFSERTGWHTPPGRVLAVWLDGIVEFETSDGEVRHVSAGGSVLVEETQSAV